MKKSIIVTLRYLRPNKKHKELNIKLYLQKDLDDNLNYFQLLERVKNKTGQKYPIDIQNLKVMRLGEEELAKEEQVKDLKDEIDLQRGIKKIIIVQERKKSSRKTSLDYSEQIEMSYKTPKKSISHHNMDNEILDQNSKINKSEVIKKEKDVCFKINQSQKNDNNSEVIKKDHNLCFKNNQNQKNSNNSEVIKNKSDIIYKNNKIIQNNNNNKIENIIKNEINNKQENYKKNFINENLNNNIPENVLNNNDKKNKEIDQEGNSQILEDKEIDQEENSKILEDKKDTNIENSEINQKLKIEKKDNSVESQIYLPSSEDYISDNTTWKSNSVILERFVANPIQSQTNQTNENNHNVYKDGDLNLSNLLDPNFNSITDVMQGIKNLKEDQSHNLSLKSNNDTKSYYKTSDLDSNSQNIQKSPSIRILPFNLFQITLQWFLNETHDFFFYMVEKKLKIKKGLVQKLKFNIHLSTREKMIKLFKNLIINIKTPTLEIVKKNKSHFLSKKVICF